MLLERDDALEALRATFDHVRTTGQGRFVVVGGEAGVGKTSLMRHLAGEWTDTATVLWGACDSLSTPRVFGPLSDIAAQVGGELAEVLTTGAAREAVFRVTLQALTAAKRPTVVIIEDAHWADEATSDLLIFLRRRVETTSAMIVVTFRDGEVPADRPLRLVLDDSRVEAELRVQLRPLSLVAVATMAQGRDVDPVSVHRITGGNPFFVSEVLATEETAVPRTVRDAVLARASALPMTARSVLDTISIVPGRVEMWLLDRLADGPDQLRAVDECVTRGMLRSEGDGLAFCHELARLAVRDAVTPVRRRELHRRAVEALADPSTGTVDPSRVAHHAFEAGDADAVVLHAPRAAAQAARVGSHREAAMHLEHAVRYAGRLPTADQVELWRRLGIERATLAEFEQAVAAYDTAADLCRSSDDVLREAELLARLSAVHLMTGHQVRALALTERAVAMLEPLGETPELAFAIMSRSAQHMLARELADAEVWGQRAIEMAQRLDVRDTLCRALVQSGVALLMAGDDAGHVRILRGMEIAREEGLNDVVGLGYSQIGSGGGEVRRYDIALPALEAGLAYSLDHELDSQGLYVRSWLARCYLEQGRLREASDHCGALLRDPRLAGISRTVTVTVAGRLRARRGDPGVWEALDEGLALARENGHLQRLWPAAVARAEAAWLAGHLESEVTLLEDTYRLAGSVAYPWAVGELGDWLARAGHRPASIEPAAEPFRWVLDGQRARAAAWWQSIGCQFEAGVALVDSDDVRDVSAALSIFDALESPTAARLAANRLRQLGARVPRGPNAATRRTPAGLTSRELEVVALLAEGMRNAEIAERLVISTKTVDHHVSSLLTKLGARSRQAAAATASRLGLVGDLGVAPLKDGEVSR